MTAKLPGSLHNARFPTMVAYLAVSCATAPMDAAEFVGNILDAETGEPVAARLYVQSPAGEWLHVESAALAGTAIPYSVRRGESVEVHTSLSAHPFRLTAPAGRYRLTAERGKEYLPMEMEIELTEDAVLERDVSLRRWSNVAKRGWYSGETHVHRTIEDLDTLVLAEDLNVAFPLTAWVTDTEAIPANNERATVQVPDLIQVDPTHVIWPVNTEYELFTVGGRRHTLGAVFVLNHRDPLKLAAPPVEPIADEARRQGAFLDLDKHNWPWSIMLVPRMQVDLFELTNNHLWRTDFHFRDWYPEYVPGYMNVAMQDGGFTERGWIDFGLQTYYALLNCGLDLKPTAGTASGVHPVPLGYGRVYVHLDGEFSYDQWVAGLLRGDSFVTTGPMLLADVTYEEETRQATVSSEVVWIAPIDAVDVVVNGETTSIAAVETKRTEAGAYASIFQASIPLRGESWVAVRAFASQPNGRVAFAHSAPRRLQAPGHRLRPTDEQRRYLLQRVTDEIERNRNVLPEAALDEYRAAALFFESLETAP